MKHMMRALAIATLVFVTSCEDYSEIFEPPPSGHDAVVVRISGVSNDQTMVTDLFYDLESLPGKAKDTPLFAISKFRASDTWFFKLSRTHDYYGTFADKSLLDSVIGVLSRHDLTKVQATIYTISSSESLKAAK